MTVPPAASTAAIAAFEARETVMLMGYVMRGGSGVIVFPVFVDRLRRPSACAEVARSLMPFLGRLAQRDCASSLTVMG